MNHILRFEDAQFKPDDWPEFVAHREEDDDAFLSKQGFQKDIEVGNSVGLGFEVWESSKTEGEWVVSFGTSGLTCYIRCYGWPNFIELLSKLSPIAIASLNRDKN